MIKDNRWRHGLADFRFPRLDDNALRPSCGFYRLTMDPAIGEEVIVFFREEPPHAKALEEVQPMALIAHKGIVATPNGIVAYIVWQIAAGSRHESYFETFLNPFEFGTLKLVSDAANQTHLKFIAVDRSDQAVVSMVDFENVFELDALLFHMAMSIGHSELTQFSAAVDYIFANMTVGQLLEQAII